MIFVTHRWLTFWLPWVKAGALTQAPLVFISPDVVWPDDDLAAHEGEHWWHQIVLIIAAGLGLSAVVDVTEQAYWLSLAWPVGILLFDIPYLLILPVKWNPFRRWTEMRAMKAEGIDEEMAADILKHPPYYLS